MHAIVRMFVVAASALLLGSLLARPALPPASAALKPCSGLRELAERSDVAVEADVLGSSRVRVVEVFASDRADIAAGAEIALPALEGHTRRTGEFCFEGGTRDVASSRVLLFLERARSTGALEPVHYVDGGSQGVWWVESNGVLKYGQEVNPGPYVLMQWSNGPGGRSGTPDEARARVRSGLRTRQVLAAARTAQGAERARLAGEYLGAPCDGGSEWWVRQQVRALCGPVPGESVAMLRPLLKEGVDPDVARRAAEAACDLGRDASALVPELRGIVENPGAREARPVYEACRALGSMGNRDVLPALRKLLAEGDVAHAAHASWALVELKDDQAAELCARRVAADPASREDADFAVQVLWTLSRLDPARAAPVARRWSKLPACVTHGSMLAQFADSYERGAK